MVLPYYPGRVDEAGQHFDEVVGLITAKEFTVKRAPESGICKECDVRLVCHAEGVIAMAED